MVAIAAPLAPAASIRPLGVLGMLALPALRLLTKEQGRIALDHRAELTRRLWKQQRFEREATKVLRAEAKTYEKLLQTALARLSMYHRPANLTDGPEKRQRPGKIQLVKFQVCYLSNERIYFLIETRKSGLFAQTNALPYQVRVLDIVNEETLKELSFVCHRVVQANIKDYHNGAWLIVNRLHGVDGLPTKVRFDEMVEHYPVQDIDKLPLVLGVGEDRRVHCRYLADHPHVLVGGSTGSGKSNILNAIICQIMWFSRPSDVRFYLVDLKEMEAAFWEGAPHVEKISYTAEEALQTLEMLKTEMSARKRLFRGKVKELSEWNAAYPDQRKQRLILIIDEMAELMVVSGAKVAHAVERDLGSLTNLGRSVGIHVFACTQRPAVEVIPNRVKVNMPLIIAGRTQNAQQSQVIMGNGDAAKLPLKPKGRMWYVSGSEQELIQTPFTELDDVRKSVSVARGRGAALIHLDPVTQQPTINSENVIAWIRDNQAGILDRKTGAALENFAITRRMYNEMVAALIGKSRVVKRDKTWYLADMVPKDVPQDEFELVDASEPAGESVPETVEPTAAEPEETLVAGQPEPSSEPAPETQAGQALATLRAIRAAKGQAALNGSTQ